MASVSGYTDSHISIETALSLDRLIELVRSIAGTKPTGLRGGPARLELSSTSSDGALFSVLSLIGNICMKFKFMGRNTADGSTGESRIIAFRTTQEKLLGVIPVAPKQIDGYFLYKHFMTSLGRAVLLEDPNASVSVIERSA